MYGSGGFFGINFFWWWFSRFCEVFCKNAVVGCGFWVVKLWWFGGETWCADGSFLASKKPPLFLKLFLCCPILGMIALAMGGLRFVDWLDVDFSFTVQNMGWV